MSDRAAFEVFVEKYIGNPAVQEEALAMYDRRTSDERNQIEQVMRENAALQRMIDTLGVAIETENNQDAVTIDALRAERDAAVERVNKLEQAQTDWVTLGRTPGLDSLRSAHRAEVAALTAEVVASRACTDIFDEWAAAEAGHGEMPDRVRAGHLATELRRIRNENVGHGYPRAALAPRETP